jgi:hypothetical protein
MWHCSLNNYMKDRYQLNYLFVSNTSMHRQLLGYLLGFLLCHYVSLRSEFALCCPLQFPQEDDVRVVVTTSCS